MTEVSKKLTVDLSRKGGTRPIFAVENDTGARKLKIRITDDGAPYKLDLGTVAILNYKRADGVSGAILSEIEEDGVLVGLTSLILGAPGQVTCSVSLSDENGSKITSSEFCLDVSGELYSGDTLDEAPEYGLLLDALSRLSEFEISESERSAAEESRVAAESVREEARESFEESVTERLDEQDGKINEVLEGESGRSDAESGREAAETERSTAEEERSTAESARSASEIERLAAEGERNAAEEERASAEIARAAAESERIAAEEERAAAYVEIQSALEVVNTRGFALIYNANKYPNWDVENKRVTIPSYSALVTSSKIYPIPVSSIDVSSYATGVIVYDTADGEFKVYPHTSPLQAPNTSILVATYGGYGAYVNMASAYTTGGKLYGVDVYDKAVTTAKLGDKAVTSSKLADGAVTRNQLGDKAVVLSKRTAAGNFGYLWHSSHVPEFDTTAKTLTIRKGSRVLMGATTYHIAGDTDHVIKFYDEDNSINISSGIICLDTVNKTLHLYNYGQGYISEDMIILAAYVNYGAIVHMAGSYKIDGKLFGIDVPEMSEMPDVDEIREAVEEMEQDVEGVIEDLDDISYDEYFGNILPIDKAGRVYSANGVTITHDGRGVFTFNGKNLGGGTAIEIVPVGESYAQVSNGVQYYIAMNYISGSGSTTVAVSAEDGSGIYHGTSSPNPYMLYGFPNDTTLNRFVMYLVAGEEYNDFKIAPYFGPKKPEGYTGVKRAIKTTQDFTDLCQAVEAIRGEVDDIKTFDEVIKSDILPDYYIAERERVIAETQALQSDLTFLLFADPHSNEEHKYRKYRDMLDNGGLDFMVGVGDYLPYQNYERADAIKDITRMLAISGRDRNCYYTTGNHDAVFSNNGVSLDTATTKKEMHRMLCSHLNGAVNFNALDPYGCYYFVDYEAAKIRLIVLNASDLFMEDGSIVNAVSSLSQKQMDWLSEKALNFMDKPDRDEWGVLVFGHNANSFPGSPNLDILGAFRDGKSVSDTYTDTDGVRTITVNADFTEQGKMDFLCYFYGDGHTDMQTGNLVQIRCDNAYLDDMRRIEIDGISAGGYYVTVEGTKFGFVLDQDYPNAKYFEYNHYLHYVHTAAFLLDENGVAIGTGLLARASDYVEGMTELTGFSVVRTSGTVMTESCAVVSINKDEREIRVIPYGLGTPRVINY